MKHAIRIAATGLVLALLVAASGCSLFNSPPVASFTWSPMEPLARTEVRFESTSTDQGGLFGGGGIATYNWDFDDGDDASSENPRHEFTKSGDYDVTLRVTDDAGETATVTKRVEITPSLDGRWRGQIIDPNGNTVDFELDLSHSASGGIQGDAYMLLQRYSCSAISFNPVTKELRFELFELAIRLEGTLDPSETRIEGDWYTLNGVQWWSWDVTLAD